MRASSIATNYRWLRPEERFRLIMAASSRRDELERSRLTSSAPRFTMTVADHAPWSQALSDVALLVYIEMLEEVAAHEEALTHWREAELVWSADDSLDEAHDETDTDPSIEEAADATDDENDGETIAERSFELFLARGYIVSAKWGGWTTFCERLGMDPLAMWRVLPGFKRFERAIDRLQARDGRPGPAFTDEGMLRWLRRQRLEGEPLPTHESLLTDERHADDLDAMFQARVEWWGGQVA